jgi:hypothetical protein
MPAHQILRQRDAETLVDWNARVTDSRLGSLPVSLAGIQDPPKRKQATLFLIQQGWASCRFVIPLPTDYRR